MESLISLFNHLPIAILIKIASWFSMFYGCYFLINGSLKMLKVPDLYSKMHAASINESFAAPLILFGVALQYGGSISALKIILLIVVSYCMSPISSHYLSQPSLEDDIKPIGDEKV